MNIIYKHKETGETINIKYMKERLHYENSPIVKIRKPLTKEEIEYALVKPRPYKTYFISEIPFSDDFEMIIEDNPYDFDECEIYTLLNALELYPYSNLTSHELKLKDKLVEIYKKLKGWG